MVINANNRTFAFRFNDPTVPAAGPVPPFSWKPDTECGVSPSFYIAHADISMWLSQSRKRNLKLARRKQRNFSIFVLFFD
jgi:hypothetical protein